MSMTTVPGYGDRDCKNVLNASSNFSGLSTKTACPAPSTMTSFELRIASAISFCTSNNAVTSGYKKNLKPLTEFRIGSGAFLAE